MQLPLRHIFGSVRAIAITVFLLAVSTLTPAIHADEAPTITSASATTFTIGQQCPELVVVGVNDDQQEVGTPCPFTVTTTGTPTPTLTVGGIALPTGVYFNDNLDGTATLGGIPAQFTAGTYALTITATNSQGSVTQQFTLTINTPPVIASGPIATPNPAIAGQTVTFSSAGFDADNNPLTYTWNFGDGTIDNNPVTTHVFPQPGTYLIYLVVTDTASAFVYDQVFVNVNPAGTVGTGTGPLVGGGNENESVVGAGPDSDGDGFSDAFETAVGTNPNSTANTPTGQPLSAGGLLPLQLSAAQIKLDFAKTGADRITFSGTLPIPAGFNPTGANLYVDVGGVAKMLTLNAKGIGANNGDSVKLALRAKHGSVAAQTARFSAQFSNGTFSTMLASATDLTDTTVRNAVATVKFTVIFNHSVYQNSHSMIYTARAGKGGSAR